MCEPTERRTREGRGDRQGPKKVVRFRTYNIYSTSNGGMESALRGLTQE